MWRIGGMLTLGLGLVACSDAALQNRWYVGDMNGQPMYEFTTEQRASMGGPYPDPTPEIVIKAGKVCPGGYKELERSAPEFQMRTYQYPASPPPNQVWLSKSYEVALYHVKIVCTKA